MRACEFCDAAVDDATNQCTSCGATQNTRPGDPGQPVYRAPAPKAHVSKLWLIWCFIPWFSGIGILRIALKTKKTAWIAEGCVYMIPFLLALMSGDDGPSDGVAGFAVIIWIITIIRGFMLKPRYEAIVRGEAR
jgi:hypothetical protein